MPSSFSTPDDKSIPNGKIFLFICSILSILIPPARNQGLVVLRLFSKAKKKKIIIKKGDHSLSNQNQLKKIINELNSIIKDII